MMRQPLILPFLLILCAMALAQDAAPSGPKVDELGEKVEAEVSIKIQLAGARDAADLLLTEHGYRYRVHYLEGRTELLTPEEFAQRVWRDATNRSWLDKVLNISSPIGVAWVMIGLIGQLLFAGRMVVQWLISEKSRRSVVPPLFWWMSLAGGTMLLVYFVWRKDIVGVLGQGMGWVIYMRNLWLIYHAPNGPVEVTVDPGPEPEL